MEDLIQDGDNGLLVEAGDPAVLADALRKLATDDSLRERLSRRAPASVMEKGMTAERMVQHYERLYESTLAAK